METEIGTIYKKDIHAHLQSLDDYNIVYILLKYTNVVYVGETKRFYCRMIEHKSDKDYDRVIVLWADSDGNSSSCMHKLEKQLIKFINPTYNIKHNN